MFSILSSPQGATVITFGVLGLIISYAAKSSLDRHFTKIPLNRVPKSSACRNLVESNSETTLPATAQGTEKSSVLTSWSSLESTHWTSAFTAIQIELPVKLLADYRGGYAAECKDDTQELVQKFVAAFLDARKSGPDGWALDKKVPPLSFNSGHHLFGAEGSLVAYMLGCWNSTKKASVTPSTLPVGAVEPVSYFPPNDIVMDGSRDTAGVVIHWKCPASISGAIDKLAAYGCPWRFVDGGFQEFIVERMSEETARVTYVTVECSALHPRSQAARDYKIMPGLLYEAHVLYAQSLILRTVRQLRGGKDRT